MNRKIKNQKGFTLIELMVTVAVAIILLGVGIPLFDTMLANNRAITQTNMFVTALNLAKSEAVSKNITSTICADADGDPATLVCGVAANYDWTNGWFVFNDLDADGQRDNDETVIKIWEPLSADTDVLATVPFVSFNSLGEKVGTALLSFRVAQVDSAAKIATTSPPRCLYLNAIGQLRTEKISAAKGSDASSATCP